MKSKSSPQQPVNMQIVADAAGVSVATISRAFKSPEQLSAKTLRLVRAKIEEFGYTPNAQARNLRTARTGLVVAMVPDISNSYFSAVIRGIEKVAYQNGYNLLLGDTQNEISRERAYAQLIASKQVDGLIAISLRRVDLTLPGRLPVVNASPYVNDADMTNVHVDNVTAAYEATDLLLAMGHRAIGLITGAVQSPVFADREAGYAAALKAADISINPRWVILGDLSVESGMAATETLFAGDPAISAIVCANDEMALGAIRAVRARGLNVPGDVSVVGFDDIPLAKYFDPPLTTVSQPAGKLGEEAMRLLIEILNDPTTPIRRRLLKTQLMLRGSTGRYRPRSNAAGATTTI